MMRMRPGEKEAVYGYRLRNYFTGEILSERQFENSEEMEKALMEDLAPDRLIGNVFAKIDGAKED